MRGIIEFLGIIHRVYFSHSRLIRRYFGFKPNAKTQVIEGDGVAAIRCVREKLFSSAVSSDQYQATPGSFDLLPSSQMDVIFIDADCKDSSLGMSAPPAAFVTVETLQEIHDVLSPGGVLVINVVARYSFKN